jgi:Spy/CpxP family protein refolding chaperone
VFFIGGAAWTRLHHPPPAGNPAQRFRELEAGLNLDARQQPAFEEYMTTMRYRTAEMHQQVGPLIASAWEEIAKANPDQARIMQLFDDAAEKRRAFQRDVTLATLNFLAVLTPTQHDKFVEIARERRPPWSRQPPPQH